MSIKLIAIDLDDTLLDDHLTISPRARETIREAVRRGVAVTVATGRMYRSALPFARQLELDVPFITYNGALIKCSISGEIILHIPVRRELAQQAAELCRVKNWYIQTYVNDMLYVKELDRYADMYSALAGVEPIPVGENIYKVQDPPTKMLIVSEPDNIPDIQQTLQNVFNDKLYIVSSKPMYVEITDPAANKGRALELLAARLKIDRQEVMAIGDSGNDLEMIKYAGLGVAMGNARPEVKAAAQAVTRHNNDDGVAAAIEKFVLI
ncbi:MAG TPA: Cof-type HAD-IIB family hydrolase [Methylomusa anaerophila]|uniref:Sugar phosphatase YidA n=1 Tax=Methylomusa anaerophila TaxID=1930071 RepID=A0A348AL04_9FIRM|nr:Cof-type HAD-IIB family hydrolase [Methylomusa anaerophila]BBB91752.1 sugar phosphatase YidA [Methylomusa anaerophila]HML88511.1 Cof-type HAD-IIB family hydrolase [Methylomusa anaerophila]